MKKLILSILVLIIVSCASVEPVQQSRQAQKQQVALKPYNDIIKRLDEAQKQYDKLVYHYQQQEVKNADIQRQIDSLKALHVPEIPEQPKAFKIYGFGKNTTGGKDGDTIRVTNLNDSGAGSFRDALLKSGKRIVKIETGGVLNLQSNIYVKNGDLTILGQFASDEGLTIRGGMVQFEASNIIVRYVRFRDSYLDDSDAVSITAWSGKHLQNIVFDHCSFSNGNDENFNIRGVGGGTVKNVTIQNCINSNGKYAMLSWEGTSNISVYRNYFTENRERNIRSNYPTGAFDFEFINNIVYGFKVGTKPSLGVKFSVVNNEYRLKSGFTPINDAVVDASSSGGGTTSETYAYIKGNIKPASMTFNDSALEPYLKSTPYLSSGIEPMPASELDSILLDVGCSLPKRDTLDERLINDYK